mgnify:CR=1 FL=1
MPKSRGKANKPVKPVLHIFCEGEKTEPIYLNGYLERFHPGNRRLNVIKVEKTKKNTPVQLVNEAIKKKKDSLFSDCFWVIYDRESPLKYPDSLHKNAYDKASAKRINIAITNVCFEVWLLLHFIEVSAPYISCDDLLKNSPLKTKLKENGITQYEKSDTTIFPILETHIQEARQRAEKMNRITSEASYDSETYKLNPYTDVYMLLDAIDAFVKKTK